MQVNVKVHYSPSSTYPYPRVVVTGRCHITMVGATEAW